MLPPKYLCIGICFSKYYLIRKNSNFVSSMNNLLRHKYIKYAVLVLFVMYLGGLFSFTHVHIENGVTIVHSHPFSDDNHHHHSETELQLLHQLSVIQHIGSFAQNITIKPYCYLVTSVVIPDFANINKPSFTKAAQLRAPPAAFLT